MTASLERSDNGTVALFINGDLQFSSVDERIYHESLALPALALASKRIKSSLRILVIGGGDGLVAREMFKSQEVASLTLVDYDPQILAFARHDLSFLNENSLVDPRINIHVQDAWDYVDQAFDRHEQFDVIISDLTVPENANEARFHSVDWYAKLARLLNKRGILAVNAVSPTATPQAYCSIFNSILKASLQARPYHIAIPSFSAMGYGQDWGFFIASPELITAQELETDLTLASPREFLLHPAALRQLFFFSSELFEYQPKALPACAGSDILIHYFNNSVALLPTCDTMRDSFTFDTTSASLPDADTGKHILPPELCTALAHSINAGEQCTSAQPEGVQLFLREVLNLMPSLQREQTSELISEFLEEPTAFLRAIDLPDLVTRLLRRASELPSQLVAELKLLQEQLVSWAGDHENLLGLGNRVMTVLVLAIVVGNLMYPDAVYAKTTGRGGRGGYGNNWGGGTTYYNNTNRRVIQKGPIGPGPNAQTERDMRKLSLPQKNDVSDAEYIDENGSIYPVRQYRRALNDSRLKSAYRLGPGTDILTDGHVAMPLTERSYLLVTPSATHVIESQSGVCVMSLQNDQELLQLTTSEISRQLRDLSNSHLAASDSTKVALQHLTNADQIFKSTDSPQTNNASTSIADGVEIFPSVRLTPDGKYLAIKREDGDLIYLDGKNCYSDPGESLLNEPYPKKFRSIVVSYLSKMVRDADATRSSLLMDKHELSLQKDMLANELLAYETSQDSIVTFGTRKVTREEAIRLSKVASHKVAIQIQSLNKHLEELPGNVDMVKLALTNVRATTEA